MNNAIRKKVGGKRPGAGRPATGSDPSRTFRLSDEFMATLDAWAARQDDEPTRSEAIRRLVELGLKVKEMSAPEFPWTPEKDGLLRSLAAAGESAAAIATLLKRTPDAVRSRAKVLKIKLARSQPGRKVKGKS